MKISFSLLFLLISVISHAQSSWEDTMYADGKINVVIAVVAILILGIGWKLWSLDKQLKQLENQDK